MPLLEIQAEILRLLAGGRSSDSYVAGGTISGKDGLRFSNDIDLFHSDDQGVLQSYSQDRNLLMLHGYKVNEITDPRPGFVRAVVTRPDGVSIRMDWAHESSFRFFPVIADELTGYELHWADAATNKALAAARREKTRDAYDLLHWDHRPLSLGALIWAAAAKDAGMSPLMILGDIRRNARISPDELKMLQISGPFDPMEAAARFRDACRDAQILIDRLTKEGAPTECLFLDAQGDPINPDPDNPESLSRPHTASKGGCWPSFPDQDNTFSP